MRSYIVQEGQSVMDIALECYGDVSAVFWLMEDNPDAIREIADRLQPGQSLLIRDEVVNPRVTAYLADFGPFATIEEIDRPTGIGYWIIDEYTVA